MTMKNNMTLKVSMYYEPRDFLKRLIISFSYNYFLTSLEHLAG